MFAKAKKVTDNNKDTNLVDYRIYYGRKKFCDTGVGFLLLLLNSFHNTLFSSELMNGPNELECYIKPR